MNSLSYLGGLVTGEGHFGLHVRRTRSGLQVNPVFSLSMTDKETIDLVAAMLTELDLSVYRNTWNHGKKHGQKKIQHRIEAHGHKRVRRYCESLIPYLTGEKREAAEVVLRFIESRMNRPRGQGVKAPYTDSEVELVNEIRRINGRPNLTKNNL